MNTIIQNIFAEYQNKMMEMFQTPEAVTLWRIEKEGVRLIREMVMAIMRAYVVELSANIRADQKGRRKAGLVIERLGDERRILTEFGEFDYKRDYYLDKRDGRYRYLVDEALDVEKKQRISSAVGLALAGAAAEMSYEKSSRYVAGGEVSRQTVMGKVRNSQPKAEAQKEKKQVTALHVDADEDHVTLSGGKKSSVPLISVYEGIGQNGKRRYCREVFHISEYGLGADELWEKSLDEIEARYDLEGTLIYLHGDGAAWIKAGLEWLPNCRFVLDKYHKNKEIKRMSSGLSPNTLRRDVETAIRESLLREGNGLFNDITRSLCKETPGREKDIQGAAQYLLSHKEGIRICLLEEEANNGGCTEPHVSHILSSRLSNRPRAWSKATLSSLAPILAARGELEEKTKVLPVEEPLLKKASAKAKKMFMPRHALGLVEPEAVGTLAAIAMGKRTPTFKAVYSFAQ